MQIAGLLDKLHPLVPRVSLLPLTPEPSMRPNNTLFGSLSSRSLTKWLSHLPDLLDLMTASLTMNASLTKVLHLCKHCSFVERTWHGSLEYYSIMSLHSVAVNIKSKIC